MKCPLIIFFLFFVSSLFGQLKITDQRDGLSYEIVQLGDLYWMLQNLRYNAPASQCQEDCDSIRFYDFRELDQVCPKGWRLPKMEEWEVFVESFDEAETVKMMEKNPKLFREDFLDQFNIFESNVLALKAYGRMEGDRLDIGNFVDYWTTNEVTDERFHMHFTPYSIVGHSHKHHLKEKKKEEYRRFPVRCVCEVKAAELAK